MKFMKLGSKPDSFQSNEENVKYVATELATDMVVNVGNMKFYLHKFPLLSKSGRLQKFVSISNDKNKEEIDISDIPGGPAAFEICAKFCYGMTVTLNAYNIVAARCAADYLEMYETVEKGNLIYKIEVFLNSSILRSWKDSILVLQTTRSLLPWSEDLKVVVHCLDAISSKVSISSSKVEWSYTYNRKNDNENGTDLKPQTVPNDWWIEDLCELHIDVYKRLITTIKKKGKVPSFLIGEAVHAYAIQKLPGFQKGVIKSSNCSKYKSLVETIICLLPTEKYSVSSNFLVKLLKVAIFVDCGEPERTELMRNISQQLDKATVADLLTIYDIDIVQNLVVKFVTQESTNDEVVSTENDQSVEFVLNTSRAMVAKLIDGYLAEVARDPNLPIFKFICLAEMSSKFPRASHDGVYRAIDMFLKEHPGITKTERKKICRLMDCKKLSAEACMHAVQNERLPLRIVVQVLFFEQTRTTNSPLDLSGSITSLIPVGSNGSSRSTTTNTEEDWDSVPTAEEIKALKGEIATLHANAGKNIERESKNDVEKVAKMKGLVMSKLMSKLWSTKERNGELSSSDTSGSGNAEETKSTPSTSRRRSLS